MKRPNDTPTIRLKKALDMLRMPNRRLMLMHTVDGDHYYVVPGGRMNRDDAEKIIQRTDCYAFDDGLFPGNPQSWRLQ